MGKKKSRKSAQKTWLPPSAQQTVCGNEVSAILELHKSVKKKTFVLSRFCARVYLKMRLNALNIKPTYWTATSTVCVECRREKVVALNN